MRIPFRYISVVVAWCLFAPSFALAKQDAKKATPRTIIREAKARAKAEAKAKEEAEAFFLEAQNRFHSDDFDGAIEFMTKAIDLSKKERLDIEIQLRLLDNLGQIHATAYDVNKEFSHLLEAKEIFERYLRRTEEFSINLQEEEVANVKARLEILNEQISNLEKSRDEKAKSKDLVPQTVQEVAKPKWWQRLGAKSTNDRPRESSIWWVTGAAGGSLVATGVGLLVYGSTFEKQAEKAIEKKIRQRGHSSENTLEDDDKAMLRIFRAEERKKGHALIATGAATAAVGTAGVIVGSILLYKFRRNSSSFASFRWKYRTRTGTWTPSVTMGERRFAFGLSGRF